MSKLSPEKRRPLLRELLKKKDFLRTIEAVNGIEAIIAENTKFEDSNGNCKVFDALWLSGFTYAAFRGKADNGLIDISEKTDAINDIFAISSKPLIVDMDTGGTPEMLCKSVALLERLGVSAIVVEDKTGKKSNSLYGKDRLHIMEDADAFAEKICIAKKALCADDFIIFARIESFIAGENLETAMLRAKKYINSGGANGIVIHSASSDGADIFEFARRFKAEFADIPLVFIPTSYNGYNDTELHKMGADIIIYANQLMRSAYSAMQKCAMSILQNGTSKLADESFCANPREILEFIDGEKE